MAKAQQPQKIELDAKSEKAQPKGHDEMVIKEIMIQKGITREEAIKVLDNPTPNRDSTKEAAKKK